MASTKYYNQRLKSQLTQKLQEVLTTYKVTRITLADSLGVDYKTFCGWTIGRTMPRAKGTYNRVMDDLNYLMENVECADVYNTVQQGKPVLRKQVEKEPNPQFAFEFDEKAVSSGEANSSGSALDIQIGGSHYKDSSIQPVQYIEANKLGFLEGCMIKRLTRHDKPTGKGREDIEKIIHEATLLLEMRYS